MPPATKHMAGEPERIQSINLGAQAPAPGPSQAPAREPDLPAAMDYRLVIEQDPKSGTFIYKTLDRATGELIHQTPREDVLRLKFDPDYRAGDVVAARI